MGKKPLLPEQKMFDAGAIDLAPEQRIEQAKKWALALWDRLAAMPGENQESAMHRAARLAKVSASMIWSFRYRMPKKLDVAAYFSIKAAYERHVASVEASLADNLLILRSLPSNPGRDRLVAQMEEFLRDQEGQEGRIAATETDADFDQRNGWGR
ncbi:hypothetical protein [Devosia sp. Root105]|uniref:hypothetical protein n=1 Tax=Devosia sp. Root105 TaxID=1736423 RepID=UPI000712B328|nr:hypothetical protein [Devosia sp. Root105]KQU96470.1 hypothetical protein ASC68_13915 [Devosia sp. Root105]